MKIPSQKLIKDLTKKTEEFIVKAEGFKNMNEEDLKFRKSDDSWNTLECLEHLNLYGDFYLPEIKRAIEEKNYGPDEIFKAGTLGNYFAKSMLPGSKGMKTFKDKDPISAKLESDVIDRFIEQQKGFLELYQLASKISLNKVKVGISISKWLKLKLGDAFRFLSNHNERHFVQIKNIQDKIPGPAKAKVKAG
jgi:hypothetical protein